MQSKQMMDIPRTGVQALGFLGFAGLISTGLQILKVLMDLRNRNQADGPQAGESDDARFQRMAMKAYTHSAVSDLTTVALSASAQYGFSLDAKCVRQAISRTLADLSEIVSDYSGTSLNWSMIVDRMTPTLTEFLRCQFGVPQMQARALSSEFLTKFLLGVLSNETVQELIGSLFSNLLRVIRTQVPAASEPTFQVEQRREREREAFVIEPPQARRGPAPTQYAGGDFGPGPGEGLYPENVSAPMTDEQRRRMLLSESGIPSPRENAAGGESVQVEKSQPQARPQESADPGKMIDFSDKRWRPAVSRPTGPEDQHVAEPGDPLFDVE